MHFLLLTYALLVLTAAVMVIPPLTKEDED